MINTASDDQWCNNGSHVVSGEDMTSSGSCINCTPGVAPWYPATGYINPANNDEVWCCTGGHVVTFDDVRDRGSEERPECFTCASTIARKRYGDAAANRGKQVTGYIYEHVCNTCDDVVYVGKSLTKQGVRWAEHTKGPAGVTYKQDYSERIVRVDIAPADIDAIEMHRIEERHPCFNDNGTTGATTHTCNNN